MNFTRIYILGICKSFEKFNPFLVGSTQIHPRWSCVLLMAAIIVMGGKSAPSIVFPLIARRKDDGKSCASRYQCIFVIASAGASNDFYMANLCLTSYNYSHDGLCAH